MQLVGLTVAVRKHLRRSTGLFAVTAVVVIASSAALVTLAVEAAHQVSQKEQRFTPGDLALRRGDTVQIANDDGDLLHHLYIDSKKFEYDSGDQEPGAKVSITFPVAGTFDVLCGIHPKMKLIVRVE